MAVPITVISTQQIALVRKLWLLHYWLGRNRRAPRERPSLRSAWSHGMEFLTFFRVGGVDEYLTGTRAPPCFSKKCGSERGPRYRTAYAHVAITIRCKSMHSKAGQTPLLTLLSTAELRICRHPATFSRGGSSISLWTMRAAGCEPAAVLRDLSHPLISKLIVSGDRRIWPRRQGIVC